MAAPRKKAAAKKKALAPRQASTEIANMQKRMKEMAQQQRESVSPSQNNKITVEDIDHFKLPDGSIVEAPMKVVVVAFMSRNVWYEKAYKEGVVSPASCAAQGFDRNDNLVPFPEADLLNQQSDKCNPKFCWANRFGSHPTSEGKACQNRKEVAVLAVATDEEGNFKRISQEMLRFDTSPIGTGKFDSWIDKIASRYDAPSCCFMANAVPIPAGPQSYTVAFRDEELLPPEIINETMNMVEAAKNMLNVRPLLQAREEEEAPARRPAKKKAAARRR